MFDQSENDFDKSKFPRKYWTYSIYHIDNIQLREVLPPYTHKPYGKGENMRVYVDKNHIEDYVTCCSRSGLVVFLNIAPIYWISNKQTWCETSTYGSDMVAMKQACEYVRGIW